MLTVRLFEGQRRCNGCGTEDSKLAEIAFVTNSRAPFLFRLCAVCAQELHEQVPAVFEQLLARSKTEGWAYPEPRQPATKLHYFVGSETLCRRYVRTATVHVSRPVAPSECCAQCCARMTKRSG